MNHIDGVIHNFATCLGSIWSGDWNGGTILAYEHASGDQYPCFVTDRGNRFVCLTLNKLSIFLI
jgi:hypothetical protein